VNDWTDITVSFLARERDRIKNTVYCMDKLKIGYWINKMKGL